MTGLVQLQDNAYLYCKKEKVRTSSYPKCFNGRCNVAILLHTIYFSILNLERNTLLYTLKELLYMKKQKASYKLLKSLSENCSK